MFAKIGTDQERAAVRRSPSAFTGLGYLLSRAPILGRPAGSLETGHTTAFTHKLTPTPQHVHTALNVRTMDSKGSLMLRNSDSSGWRESLSMLFFH